MKKLYALFSVLIAGALVSQAQNPTSVFVSSDCNFVRDFDASDEGFSSPSIYADDENTSFYWTAATDAWIESSGLAARDGSLISPVYLNTMGGQTAVGFSYNVPAGTEYRIRIISGTIASQLEILATTANGPVWDPLPSTSGNLCLLLVDPDLYVGATLRYEVSFRAVNAGDMLFDNFAINSANAPLPVTFLGFVAKKNNDGTTNLLWNVGEEINVNSYVVERSSNGTDFTTVGTVSATGKSNYSLADNMAVNETRYYRVKNVDIDGSSKYTPVIKVTGNKRASGQIQLYPVPAYDQVYVQHDKAPDRGNIAIHSLDGRLVRQVRAIANTYQTSLPISDLKAGMYIIKYDDGSGYIQSAKLVKN